jgi:hypothetical protein
MRAATNDTSHTEDYIERGVVWAEVMVLADLLSGLISQDILVSDHISQDILVSGLTCRGELDILDGNIDEVVNNK